MVVTRCPKLRRFFSSRAAPWIAFVLISVLASTWQNARDENRNAEGRDVLCRYVNRVVDGAVRDREFLVVLTQRPGLPPNAERDAIIRAYLDFGPKAFPHLDCADVRAGRLPPGLPSLPPSPLAQAATSTTTTTRP